MNRIRSKNGFVLLIVLAVLVIAATVLASAARRASEQSLRASLATDRLQYKWARLSLGNAFASQAQELLESAEREPHEPSASAETVVSFGDTRFRIMVGDEQAKANVNHMAEIKKRNSLRKSLQNIIESDGFELHEWLPDTFTCYEELFDLESIEKLPEVRLSVLPARKINYKTASAVVIAEMTEGVLNDTEVQKLLALRMEQPDIDFDQLIMLLALDEKQAEKLESLVTAESSSYSIWIIAEYNTYDRYGLCVYTRPTSGEEANTTPTMAQVFIW